MESKMYVCCQTFEMASSSSTVAAGYYKQIVAGSAAGMASVAVCHPLDTIRTRLQSSPEKFHGLRQTIQVTYQKEALRGFYKGFFPPLFSQAIYKSVIFTTSSKTKAFLNDRFSIFRHNYLLTICCSGAFAGGVNSIVVTPVELVRNRLQCQYEPDKQSRIYRNSLQVISSVIRKQGFFGLWQGMSAALYRDSLGVACYFFGFELLNKYLGQYTMLPPNSNIRLLSSGAFGGICFWAVALPFDTIKTITQVENSGTSSFYSSAKAFYRENGIKAFYRGWQAAFSRGIPSAAITFWVYSSTLKAL